MAYYTIRDLFIAVKDRCDVISIDTSGNVVFGRGANDACKAAVMDLVQQWLLRPRAERIPDPNYWAILGGALDRTGPE